jgi:hypothetical protein
VIVRSRKASISIGAPAYKVPATTLCDWKARWALSYLSRSVVANRQHHRTESDAQSLISRRNDQIRSELPGFTGRVVGQQKRFAPILCCREGVERRELDLQVAAKDATFWWETGLVPLRATPRA